MGIFTKGINPRAYANTLHCPHPHPKDWNRKCGANKWKIDEARSNPMRKRYICGQCGKAVLYDISNINPELLRVRK